MRRTGLWHRNLWALFLLGCSPGVVDQDIVRPGPGERRLKTIPGPLGGPFSSFQDALLAACDKIITKPNAVAVRPDSPNFETYWRVASEYCAWIYYTPDEKYEMSKLTDQSEVNPTNNSRTCLLPSDVADQRHPPDSIKYICAIHNHLFDDPVSRHDIGYIVSQAYKHGAESETKDGITQISAVAFFANDRANPACDGFYQYIPASHHILKWTHARGQWTCEQTGRVVWEDDGVTFSIQKANGPCVEGGGQ
jgi:hypothetical protein